MGRYIVKSTPNKVLVDKVVDTFHKVVALDKAQKGIDKKLQEDITPIINEAIPEIREMAEQAAQDAGIALGDVQTLYNVDLPDLDSRTIDKVEAIDTWYDSVYDLTAEDYGVTWNDTFSFEYNGGTEHTAPIYHRVPFVAGDNISFDVEEDVVRISADLSDVLQRISALENRLASLGVAEEGKF